MTPPAARDCFLSADLQTIGHPEVKYHKRSRLSKPRQAEFKLIRARRAAFLYLWDTLLKIMEVLILKDKEKDGDGHGHDLGDHEGYPNAVDAPQIRQ